MIGLHFYSEKHHYKSPALNMLLNSCAHLFYYKITIRGYKRGKHRGQHYKKEPSKITNDLPLVLHLPEGLRPSAVIVAGCDLLYLLPFFFLLHYI